MISSSSSGRSIARTGRCWTLAEAIRKHSVPGGGVGVTYQGIFHFQNGGDFKTTMYLIPDGFSLSMPATAGEEDWPTNDVHLPAPLPPKVKALFDFLNEPWEKVAGSVLLMKNGQQPTIVRDSSLIAG